MSVPLPRTNQVSVHIADVTHFVARDSPLDAEARARATSAYFVRRVLPMLPEELSTDLCSLNAGVDRLAFSVECEVDREGQILSSWVGRTVMQSAFKMDYDTAQLIIDRSEAGEPLPPKPEGAEGPFGGHTWEELCQDVLALHALAQRRRGARKGRGAVIMESGDLYFDFDEDGNPTECVRKNTREKRGAVAAAHMHRDPHLRSSPRPVSATALAALSPLSFPRSVKIVPQEEANQMVEEFMLLANNVAAEKMTKARGSGTGPGSALLVRNPPPSAIQLKRFSEAGEQFGAGAVETPQEVAQALAAVAASSPEMGKVLFRVAMPLQRASYFHSEEFSLADWHHYALAIDRYTHFTSPIRRFADMTVHRILGEITDAEAGVAPAPAPAAAAAAAPAQEAAPGGSTVISAGGKKGKQQMKITVQGVKTVGTAGKPAQHVGTGKAAAALDAREVAAIALHCNDRKRSAKRAQKDNQNYFLFLLLQCTGPRRLRAFVTQAGAKGAALYIPDLNSELRVNYDRGGAQGSLHKPSRAVLLQRAGGAARDAAASADEEPASLAATVAPAMDYSALEAAIAATPGPSAGEDGVPLSLPLPVVLRVGDMVPVLVQASLQPRRRPELAGALCFEHEEGAAAGGDGDGGAAGATTAAAAAA